MKVKEKQKENNILSAIMAGKNREIYEVILRQIGSITVNVSINLDNEDYLKNIKKTLDKLVRVN